MGRKTWVKPMTLVQKFEANEAVAATQCYEIACESDVNYWNQGLSDPIKINAPRFGWCSNEGFSNGDNAGKGRNLPMDFNHDNECKIASKNIFRVEGNEIEFLGEYSAGGFISGAVCGKDLGADGVLGAGDIIYWHTDGGAFNSIRWNHWGRLQPISNDHPLRS